MIRFIVSVTLLFMNPVAAWGVLEGISIPGNLESEEPSLSADGRFVSFSSKSTNFVPNDNNDSQDIFVFDRQTQQMLRASVDASGMESNSLCGASRLSADGSEVMFTTLANNLGGGDSGSLADVFVKNLSDGSLELISVGIGNVAADGDSIANDFSPDGRYVVFESTATNLTMDITPAGVMQIFLYDRQTQTTELISRASGGAIADADSFVPVVSADGILVAFESLASNLGTSSPTKRQIFVRDRTANTTVPVCLDAMSNPASDDCFDPEFADDGNLVFFYTNSPNLAGHAFTQIYFRNLGLGTTSILPITGQLMIAAEPDVSDDGQRVVFISPVTPTFIENIFLYERDIPRLSLISQGFGGVPADANSSEPVISADGKIVAVPSGASNLVPLDTNNREDVFVRDLNLVFVSGFEEPSL